MDGSEESITDMSVYERLDQDDVQYLDYFPADRCVLMLTLIGGQPPLVTVDTVLLRSAALSVARFVTPATLLTRAMTRLLY